MLELVPITLKKAQAFIGEYHRHNKPPRGAKFAVAAASNGLIIGIATAGRPIARGNDDGYTLEVTRCCVIPGYTNACSKLYAACIRAAKAMGYRRVITYTLQSEPGISLRAAGFQLIASIPFKEWSWSGRPRKEAEACLCVDKNKWAYALTK